MKNYKSIKEVVKAFSKQLEYEGKNVSGSLYFVGNQMYSYGSHYLLAEIVSEDIVLINNQYYSKTTAKHRSAVMSGIKQYVQMDFIVSDTDKLIKFFEDTYDKLIDSKTKASYYKQIADKMYKDFCFFVEQEFNDITVEECNDVVNCYALFQSELVKSIIEKQAK